jgi:biotin operon repressor
VKRADAYEFLAAIDGEVHGLTRWVLREYLDHADGEMVAWPGVATLAEVLGTSERTVWKCRQRLRDLGYLELVEAGGGRGKPTKFRIQKPCPQKQ